MVSGNNLSLSNEKEAVQGKEVISHFFTRRTVILLANVKYQ